MKKIQNNDKFMIKFSKEESKINIRPVSDLRNRYPEIEELVLKENEVVYLTKKRIWLNGSNEFRKIHIIEFM